MFFSMVKRTGEEVYCAVERGGRATRTKSLTKLGSYVLSTHIIARVRLTLVEARLLSTPIVNAS